VLLDGAWHEQGDEAWHEQGDELVFVDHGHLSTSEVGAVLARTIRRIERHLRRCGVLVGNEDDDLHGVPETDLAAAAVSGQVPPAGPQWAVRLRPPERRGLAYDKPLCASREGFTLHAATRAGALDARGLGAASEWRSRIVPPADEAPAPQRARKSKRRSRYRTWAELLARTLGVDALACPVCQGRMRLVAVLRNPARIARYLASIGEPTELPKRSPSRGPPYWKSRVLRRMASGHDEVA
jgi:hypothetical protein